MYSPMIQGSARTFFRDIASEVSKQKRIFWALLMRELTTRYGRSNIGFLWLIGEPLLFAAAVTTLWHFVRGQFEQGLLVVPFTVCGYMSIILVRHVVGHGVGAVRANSSLLYHRNITVIHLFVSRLVLEILSVTLAGLVLFVITYLLGAMPAPKDLPYIYLGWAILAWQSVGLALILGAIGEVVDFMERVVGLITYIIMPISAVFYMVAWVPPQYQSLVLLMPLVHPIEMIRRGEFGEFIPSHFSIGYAVLWAGIFTLVGLFLLRFVRSRVEIE